MITITWPDLGDRPHALTLSYTGSVEGRTDADKAIDEALEQAFTTHGAVVVYGSCREGDALLDYWRRQLGRVVHTHPWVSSQFSEWQGDTLVWHWGKASEALSRRTNWEPFATRAAWELSLRAAPAIGPGDVVDVSVGGVNVTRVGGRAVGLSR